jgi:hypothetical protein
MPHHTHKMTAYRDTSNVWVEFCELCGCDDGRLEQECNRRYAVDNNTVKVVDTATEQD